MNRKLILIGDVAGQLFRAVITLYVILLIAEYFKQGSVSYFMDINWVGIVVIESLLVAQLARPSPVRSGRQMLTRHEWYGVGYSAVITCIIAVSLTSSLGWISLISSIVLALAIAATVWMQRSGS